MVFELLGSSKISLFLTTGVFCSFCTSLTTSISNVATFSPFNSADIVVFPIDIPVTIPFLSITATFLLLLFHLTLFV